MKWLVLLIAMMLFGGALVKMDDLAGSVLLLLAVNAAMLYGYLTGARP